MQFNLDKSDAKFVINAYDIGYVKINESRIEKSVLVTPDQMRSPWTQHTFEELSAEDFVPIVDLNPDVAVIGTGARLRFPSRACLQPLRQAGISVEIMDTGAACRCYTVLTAENRSVAAALLMIEP